MTTLTEGRRALARRPGFGYEVVTTGVETDGVYAGEASGDDARRVIVTTDLARQAVSGASTSDAQNDLYNAYWAYVPVTQAQRQVARDGYTPDADADDVTTLTGSDESVAQIYVVRNFAAALEAGATVEFHGPAPVLDAGMMPGLHTFLRRAARAMVFRDRLSIVADGTRRASMAAYPWIFEEGQLIGVFDAETTSGTDPTEMLGGGEFRFDAEVPYLSLGQAPSSGTTFFVDVWRPRSSWIKARRTARATATVALTTVSAIAVSDGGTGYDDDDPPSVVVSGDGTGATAVATVANGVVTSIAVTAPGTGYTAATVSVDAPAGTWAASTVGPVNEDDDVFVDGDAWSLVAYYFACDALSQDNPRGEVSSWAKRRDRAALAAAPFMMWQRPAVAQANRRTYAASRGAGYRPSLVGRGGWP